MKYFKKIPKLRKINLNWDTKTLKSSFFPTIRYCMLTPTKWKVWTSNTRQQIQQLSSNRLLHKAKLPPNCCTSLDSHQHYRNDSPYAGSFSYWALTSSAFHSETNNHKCLIGITAPRNIRAIFAKHINPQWQCVWNSYTQPWP